MTTPASKDPLHGMTLEVILNALVAQYGWVEMAKRVNINCFKSDPSIKSSLKFLRRTPWARKEVEDLYIGSLRGKQQQRQKVSQEPAQESPWASWRGNKSE